MTADEESSEEQITVEAVRGASLEPVRLRRMATEQIQAVKQHENHPSTQRVPDRAATILSPALAATGEMRPAPPSGSIIGTGIAHGVAWLRTPPAPGARLGRVYIWHRQGSAWARFAVAAESAALESRGMPQQMGLYYAVPLRSDGNNGKTPEDAIAC